MRIARPITHTVVRPLTDPLVGSASFTPAQLFKSGEQGAWYDPSDLSTLFQDAAGTTPVTAVEQPVGRILDKSGRGNHATQATAANRPLLKQDGNGKYYLEFDGVNDALSATFALTQPFERVAAFAQISWTASDLVFDGGTGGNLYQWSASPRLNSWNNGSSLVLDTAPIGSNVCTYERFNGASSRFGISDDFYRVVNNGPNNLSRWVIGGGGGASSNIRFYGGMVRAGTLAYSTIRSAQAYFAANAGIVLWTENEANEMLIVAGQSNAISRGTADMAIPSPLAAIDAARVKIWDGSAFVGYVVGTNSAQDTANISPNAWGPEAQYAIRWLADHPAGTLYIVKSARGSTDIGTWVPGGGNWVTLANNLYAAKAALASTPHVTKALWAQGEDDAVVLATANAYSTNLPILLDGLRYQLGAKQISVMRISDNSPSLTYRSTVRAAQASVCAAYDYAHLINTDDLVLSDSLHYDAPSVSTMGSRMYDAIIARAGIEG